MSGDPFVEQRVKLADHFAESTVEPEKLKSASVDELKNDASINDQSMESTKPRDVRIAVVGNVDSGKSTLIGVLTGGTLDNGRGLARSRVFMHKHENDSGRTSCISQHIMGYQKSTNPSVDVEGQPSSQPPSATIKPIYNPSSASASSLAKTKGWTSVVSQSTTVCTFIDLAGHESYLKTTIAGLTGSFPDVALIVVNSLAGLSKMSKEHLGIVLALNLPIIVVVTKVDLAPQNVLIDTKTQLFKVLKSPAANKMPIQIKSSADVQFVLTNQSDDHSRIAPVFFVSCVTGLHIPLLHEYLAGLNVEERRAKRFHAINQSIKPSSSLTTSSSSSTSSTASSTAAADAGGCEFMIDETFLVTGVGVVVSGTVQRGTFHANSTLLLGPASDGSFKPVFVRSLHLKRSAVDSVGVGDSCAASIRAVGRREHLTRTSIRRGMCLVDPTLEPQACSTFEASIHILHHPTTIKVGYQAVIHAGMVRQAATLVKLTSEKKVKSSGTGSELSNDCLRTGDRALARFRFVLRPELLHAGTTFIFREGSTKGIGHVVRTTWSKEEMLTMIEEEEVTRKANFYRKNRRNEIEIDQVDEEEDVNQSMEPSMEQNQPINHSHHVHAHPRPHAHSHVKPRSHAHGKPTINNEAGAASLSDLLAQTTLSDKREKQAH